jgi:uncharacterized membrane protein YedE/YeeE
MAELPITTVVGGAAFLAGMALGATAQRTNFCTMGALSDIVFMGDWRRFRSWMLAVAVAIIATQGLQAAGLLTIGKSIYLTKSFGWAGAILGGLMFGFGMTMGGGCGNKTLVRIGGGNLKSLVVALVLGVFAYMTLRGLIGIVRVNYVDSLNLDLGKFGLATQGLDEMLARATGLAAGTARWVAALTIGGGLIAFSFKDPEFRGSPRDIIAGVLIGLLVTGGWYITGVLGNDEFDPVALASFTFVAPTGESIQYLMTFTGSTINFGIAAVGGVICGSFLMSLATRSFHLEAFSDANDMLRHLFGAALMGVGGVLALGCTIGQGLTGVSTLALGSWLALGSILAGGVLGLKYLEEGSLTGAVKAVFARA